jgi:hypothetical protein
MHPLKTLFAAAMLALSGARNRLRGVVSRCT